MLQLEHGRNRNPGKSETESFLVTSVFDHNWCSMNAVRPAELLSECCGWVLEAGVQAILSPDFGWVLRHWMGKDHGHSTSSLGKSLF